MHYFLSSFTRDSTENEEIKDVLVKPQLFNIIPPQKKKKKKIGEIWQREVRKVKFES